MLQMSHYIDAIGLAYGLAALVLLANAIFSGAKLRHVLNKLRRYYAKQA